MEQTRTISNQSARNTGEWNSDANIPKTPQKQSCVGPLRPISTRGVYQEMQFQQDGLRSPTLDTRKGRQGVQNFESGSVLGGIDDKENKNGAKRTIRVPKVRPTTTLKKPRNSMGKGSINNENNSSKIHKNSSAMTSSTTLAGNLNNPATHWTRLFSSH